MTISTRGIRTPNDGDDWDLTLDLAAMAITIDDAIGAGLKTSSTQVANLAERAALFPIPAQGNRVWRSDLGYEEAYYAAYNLATNPGGAAIAGWYPVAGSLPFISLSRKASQAIPSGTGTVMSAVWGATADRNTDASFFSYASGAITVNRSGRYEINTQVAFSNVNGANYAVLKKNSTSITDDANSLVRVDFLTATGNYGVATISNQFELNAGDVLRILAFTASASGTTLAPLTSRGQANWSVTYNSPLVAATAF